MINSDPLVGDPSLLGGIDDWEGVLGRDPEEIDTIRKHTRTERPCRDAAFVAAAERVTGRSLRKRRPGRKRKRKYVLCP